MKNQSISKTLFHFTGLDGKRQCLKPENEALNTIQQILNSRHFKVSINERIYAIPGTQIFMEVPMSCFTETPLKYLRQHMGDFGEFGIGMKFDWAIRKGLLNVIYTDNREHNFYGESLAKIWKILERARADGSAFYDRGMFYTLVGITEDIKYRNEREWRFIPQNDLGTTNYQPAIIEFAPEDVDSIVIPGRYAEGIKKYIRNNECYSSSNISITESEAII